MQHIHGPEICTGFRPALPIGLLLVGVIICKLNSTNKHLILNTIRILAHVRKIHFRCTKSGETATENALAGLSLCLRAGPVADYSGVLKANNSYCAA
jgi:hypothetical protein